MNPDIERRQGSMLQRAFALAAAVLILSSCASAGPTSITAVGPSLSVENFLKAANLRDHYAMASIFGTAGGPIESTQGNTFSCAFKRMGSWIGLGERCVTWQEIELRMDAIALILRHDDFRVVSEASVAGRQRPTTRVLVDIQRGANWYREVPFVVVQASPGRWLVEEIELGRLTTFRAFPRGMELVAEGGTIGHLDGRGV
jgi:hypothetical protein